MLVTLFTLIIISGILLVVGKWLTTQWEARQQETVGEQGLDDAAASRLTTYTTAIRTRLSSVQANLFAPKQAPVAAKFRLWLTSVLGTEPVLQHWLMSLSDSQLDALAVHIARFTREMGFDLNWLLDQEVAQQPALARALAAVVLDYCRACHHAVGLQDELEVYKALRQYTENPNVAQNREFGQALFGKILEQGLTSIKVADHLALPEPARRQQIVETIKLLTVEKQAALQRIVKEMLTQSNGTAPSPSVSPAALNGAVSQAKP